MTPPRLCVCETDGGAITASENIKTHPKKKRRKIGMGREGGTNRVEWRIVGDGSGGGKHKPLHA